MWGILRHFPISIFPQHHYYYDEYCCIIYLMYESRNIRWVLFLAFKFSFGLSSAAAILTSAHRMRTTEARKIRKKFRMNTFFADISIWPLTYYCVLVLWLMMMVSYTRIRFAPLVWLPSAKPITKLTDIACANPKYKL